MNFEMQGVHSVRSERMRHMEPTETKGVFRNGDAWLIGTSESEAVEVESTLAQNIALALRIQGKVDDALKAGHRPGFIRTIQMLNCRKTVSAVQNKTPLTELVRRKELSNPESPSRKEIDEASGIPELRADVTDIIASGRTPVLGSTENMQIEEYLEAHPHDLPAVVHVFDIQPQRVPAFLSLLMKDVHAIADDTLIMKLGRNHTFMVLGKNENGTYQCFHKQGPATHHSFELRELNSLVRQSVVPQEGWLYLSVIGPASTTDTTERAITTE